MGLLAGINQLNPFAKGTVADKIGDTYERYKIIMETVAPLLSGRTGEHTPDFVKSALLGSNKRDPEGHELMDEKVYMRILYQLSHEEREWILSFTKVEYPTDHPQPWVREAAKDGLDQWRKWVMFLVEDEVTRERTTKTVTKRDNKGRPAEEQTKTEPYDVKPRDDSPAINYLKLIVADLKNSVEYVARKRKLTNTTIATMTKRQINACKEEAFGRVTLNMQQLGQTWMPSPDDKPFATKAISFAQKMLKKRGATGQQLLTAALARSKSFIEFALQKVQWFDNLLARYAATSRHYEDSCLSWWGAYKYNRALGMRPHSAAYHAPRVARESRYGPWKRWTYRFVAAIMPFQ